MPTRSEYVSAELFMEHEGVCIFHVYKNDDVDQGARTYWFATHEDGSDDSAHGENGVFDVRSLPVPPTGPKLHMVDMTMLGRKDPINRHDWIRERRADDPAWQPGGYLASLPGMGTAGIPMRVERSGQIAFAF